MINRISASVLAAGLLVAGVGAAGPAAHTTSDPVEPASSSVPLLGPVLQPGG